MRNLFTVLAFILAVPALAAGPVLHTDIQYRFYFPRPANVFSLRGTCLWTPGDNAAGDKISAGFAISAGYGFEKFTQGSSMALVYGPSFFAGPAIRCPLSDRLALGLCVGASGNYAHYPVVFRAEACADVLFSFNETFRGGVGLSLMFPSIGAWGYDMADTTAGASVFCGVKL